MWQLTRSIKIIKEEGFGVWFSAVKQYLEETKGKNKVSKINLDHWNYITDYVKNEKKPFLPKPQKGEIPTLNWIIPPFGKGSGGHLNIFRYIFLLEKMGYFNRIYVFGQTGFNSPDEAKIFIQKNFFPINSEIHLSTDNIANSDGIIATSWETAYVVNTIGNCYKKFYFIQDYEPNFFPKGSESFFAENTYRFDLHRITMGPWISDLLHKNFYLKSDYLEFGYDPKIYGKNPPDLNRKSNNHIFFYSRPATARRCFDLGLLALKELNRRGIEFKLFTVGQEIHNYDLPFTANNLGILTLEELGKLYSNTDLGLVFSSTNTSLLPFEMMASGCPVIELKSPSNSITFPNPEIIRLADPNPIGIADAIEELLKDEQKRKHQIQTAYEYVSGMTWEKSAEKLDQIIRRILED